MENQSTIARFIQSGIKYAEINEFLSKELREEGFSSMSMNSYNLPIQITIRALKTHEIAGDKKTRIKALQSVIAQRLNVQETDVVIALESVQNKGLCPFIQADSIRQKIQANIPFKRAVNGAIRTIKEAGAQGVMVVVSGKLKGQRAKSVKFSDGVLLHSGQPCEDYVRKGFTSILLKTGVIGIKVYIMLPYDKDNINGPNKEMVDKIRVFDNKDEMIII
ncbi:ribosomal protein S3 [Hamiltosporidium tvaerminnensis]|uniref:40S ribosomal protein S3 n=5 Tax=Hamiltosporidium TaxID=1176354 RepID=A0A4Q9LFR0_9MICR|nr:40S ribosomal protein S3 [Hamiltosporidium tvaerminnensis]TBU04685.1 ribosomal protein S3 [Hamiltosporidium magnivora]KAK1347323.1 40S ribosomal protein S3 [Hamiltosporidium tvaerminnensis]TBU02966.1 ribosomal protein S3 [Hamiltosporidium tvaerminnensis]TBU04015.1 ribosomal protein S3 [Hamiltosporidium tvaerminnensis]